MDNFERGSEWRRWDLHIHTPDTKKNDCYSGKNSTEKWEKFYNSISDYTSRSDEKRHRIAAIGITDYLSIDNYRKVVEDNRLPGCICAVFPNVEMRALPVAAKAPVNIHFIFDPNIVNELEDRFFGNLSFSLGDRKYSARRSDLIQLGKAYNPSIKDDAVAYQTGIEQYVPSIDTIIDLFSSDKELRDRVIIGVSNNSSDGVSGVTDNCSYFNDDTKESQLSASRLAYYKFADFIFSGNPKDVRFFLGESESCDVEGIKEKFGSLMPCLHGSDAHAYEKLFEPDKNRYCWIKSDPTFNGLKQVLYEPKDRVRIQELEPEQKADYHVIERVEIDNDEFSSKPLLLNDKLVCIIGGKSTGKSLLLHNMARAVDSEQADKKSDNVRSNTKKIQNIKVFWRDGSESVIGKQEDEHKIIYIPQTYLNQLSDEKEESTEIDEIIERIIMQDKKMLREYENLKKKVAEKKKTIDQQIYLVIQEYEDIKKIESTLAEMGTTNGIRREIKKLREEKETLSKECQISDEEINKYDNAVSEIARISEAMKRRDSDLITIENLDTVLVKKEREKLEDLDLEKLTEDIILDVEKNAGKEWDKRKKEILDLINAKKAQDKKVIAEANQTKNQYEALVSENAAIKQIAKQLSTEEEKLFKSEKLELDIKEKRASLIEELKKISLVFEDYKNLHTTYAERINADLRTTDEALLFSVEVPFKNEAFCNMISNVFDGRSLKAKRNIIEISSFDIEKFDSQNLFDLLYACITGDLPVKGQSIENAIRQILSNWYNITYNVRFENDTIEKMSPGKKALVLLKLLIDLAESECPILIDQPEDDLDNRSVFEELIPFIRERKISRQIIVVTHNANVVLGGDAEQVIIANQDGINSPNKEKRFEYRSGSIENIETTDCKDEEEKGILERRSIQQHICDILEGGKQAFDLRKNKYVFKGTEIS